MKQPSDNPLSGKHSFGVHFCVGFAAGGLISLLTAYRWVPPGRPELIAIAACSVLSGLVAGIWGDKFWSLFLRFIRWLC